MRDFRCKCGKLTAYGSMDPPRCCHCDECGSDLASAPGLHRDPPADHDFSAVSVERGLDGPVEIPVCLYCGKAEWGARRPLHIDRHVEREEERLESDYEAGRLTREEYNEEMRLLQREARDAYAEEYERQREELDDEWGF
jgi:hypothetical protein